MPHRLALLHVLPLLLSLGLAPACSRPAQPEAGGGALVSADTSYRFDRPDAAFELPGRLREISGLTFLDDRHLGAVQDEEGDLYVIDAGTGEVVEEKRFGRDRDYEGIERVGDRLFVLASDGQLYAVDDWRAPELDAKHVETPLDDKYDTEGLAYDAANERLLIACKEYPGKDLGGRKAVYAYDLAAGRLVEEPAFLVDTEAFTESVPDETALDDRLRSFLSPLADLSGFKPSALALHPVTGQLYLLSSVRKAIVVLAPGGEMVGVWELDEELLRQPEGLAFLPNGDLFVSSEGGPGTDAVLLRFNYRP